jgi:hypothetical protein
MTTPPPSTRPAPAVEAETFGRRVPCEVVYAVVYDAWLQDVVVGKFPVGLDFVGGPVGFGVPVIVRYAPGRSRAGDGRRDEADALAMRLRACGYLNVRVERAGT